MFSDSGSIRPSAATVLSEFVSRGGAAGVVGFRTRRTAYVYPAAKRKLATANSGIKRFIFFLLHKKVLASSRGDSHTCALLYVSNLPVFHMGDRVGELKDTAVMGDHNDRSIRTHRDF